MKNIQPLIDAAAATARFRMSTIGMSVWTLIEKHDLTSPYIPAARQLLGQDYTTIARSLIRQCFLTEIVKAAGTKTTKFSTRWDDALQSDPRFCPPQECLQILASLLKQLTGGWLANKKHAQALTLAVTRSILPYELPIDYIARPADPKRRIHRLGNIQWAATDTMLRTLKLRDYLLDPKTSPDAKFFSKVLADKIKVKAYPTDRTQTGGYKTNREKRWEVHPMSVHFATRQTCMEIEHALVTQLCSFKDFPPAHQAALQAKGILPANLTVLKCPVTLDPLSFVALQAELNQPVHGRSHFQVGHVNPLKANQNTATSPRHTADNIVWMTEDGNRLQGSMTIPEVQALLARVAKNYQAEEANSRK